MAKPTFDVATALQTAMLAAQWLETMKEYEDARPFEPEFGWVRKEREAREARESTEGQDDNSNL